MEICLHKSVLGGNFNLVFNDATMTYKWTKDLPQWSWMVSKKIASDRSVIDLAKLNGINFLLDHSNIYSLIYKTLYKKENIENENISWIYVLPKKELKLFCDKIFSASVSIVNELGNDEYYNKVFVETQKFLFSLERANIDRELLYFFLKKEEFKDSNLKSFIPSKKTGPANKIEYDRFSTITGRLSVCSGPKIIHLKKEYRKIIKSRYGKDGKIVYLDYSSLEPRLALYFAGQIPEKDVYEQVRSALFEGKLSREKAKIFVLSILYGMSEGNIIEKYNIGEQTREIVQEIKKFFKIKELAIRLTAEKKKFNRIKNFFGRNIFVEENVSPYVLVNYYIQSTAMDIALLGFRNMVNFIKKENLLIHPLFVIVDGIILDVHKDCLKYIEDLKLAGSKIKEINEDLKFWIKDEEI